MRAVLVLLIVVVGCLIAFSPASHGNTVQSADLAQVSPSAELVTAHPPTSGVTEAQGVNDGIAQTTDLVRPTVVTSVVTAIPNKVVSTTARTLIGELLDQLLAPLRNGASTPELTPTPMRPILVAARLPATPVVATPKIEATSDARQARVPILMYHYVSAVPDPSDGLRVGLSVTPEILDQHLKFFKSHAIFFCC